MVVWSDAATGFEPVRTRAAENSALNYSVNHCFLRMDVSCPIQCGAPPASSSPGKDELHQPCCVDTVRLAGHSWQARRARADLPNDINSRAYQWNLFFLAYVALEMLAAARASIEDSARQLPWESSNSSWKPAVARPFPTSAFGLGVIGMRLEMRVGQFERGTGLCRFHDRKRSAARAITCVEKEQGRQFCPGRAGMIARSAGSRSLFRLNVRPRSAASGPGELAVP